MTDSCFWLFGDDGRLVNLSTMEVLTMEMSFDAFEYQLKMKKPRVDDALQRWILDDDVGGGLKSEAHPDIRVTSQGSTKFDEELEGARKGKRTARVMERSKGAQDQSLSFVVLMREKKV